MDFIGFAAFGWIGWRREDPMIRNHLPEATDIAAAFQTLPVHDLFPNPHTGKARYRFPGLASSCFQSLVLRKNAGPL
jgi:hypothetical protein